MNGTFTRRDIVRAGLAFAASLTLPQASVRACEAYCSTLRVNHPWTRATDPGADFAVVGMTIDEVKQDDRLIAVETPVARGVQQVVGGIAGPLDLYISKGRDMVLDDDGDHLRLVNLKHPLLVGRSYPIRLVFEKGGAVDMDLSVDYLSRKDASPMPRRPRETGKPTPPAKPKDGRGTAP